MTFLFKNFGKVNLFLLKVTNEGGLFVFFLFLSVNLYRQLKLTSNE